MNLSIISSILFYSTFILASCNANKKVKNEFINTSINTMPIVTKISIGDLIKKFKSLQGSYIETEGVVYYEFENVSICSDNGQDSKCFWLDLNFKDSLLQKNSGQQCILKGVIDTSSKGHLNANLATIRNVYYLKQK
jgi:hypothetical protein